jgi:hypothetical protein
LPTNVNRSDDISTSAGNIGAPPLRVEAGFQDASYTAQFQAWIKRQNDWRADAHIDTDASAHADALVQARGPVTPEQDLAALEAATAPILDDAAKQELEAAGKSYDEAKAMADAYAACRLGGKNT